MGKSVAKRAVLLMLGLSLSLHSMAITVGVFGQVFPIEEQDFLVFIHHKLACMQQDGHLEQAKAAFIKRVKEHTLRPTPVAGITTTDHPKTWEYDPSFVLTRNITDGRGHVLYHQGMRINPLDPVLAGKYHVPLFNETLIFINADDDKEIHWLKHTLDHYQQVKVILVKGNIKRASKALKSRIYFDQNGVLCHHFGITHVPSILTRVDQQLQIKEIGRATLMRGSHHG